MRIALVGATTAGKSSIANCLADYIGRDVACVHDVDDFVAEKWMLSPPGLRRLWLRELTADEQITGIPNLIAERESEFQDRLDTMASHQINIIAMGTHVYRNAANNPEPFYRADPRKHWWTRYLADVCNAETQTHVLRLDIAARDMHVRMLERYQHWSNTYEDMTESFSMWADRQVWDTDGTTRNEIDAVRSLHQSQVINLLPHYWQLPCNRLFPSLLVLHGHLITAEEVLRSLHLPPDRQSIRALA